MRRAVCPGSFDPLTRGHLDIIARAAALYDEVVVAVLHNEAKSGLFTPGERVAMIERAVADLPASPSSARGVADVRVVESSGRLLVDLCREVGADVIVKGLRGEADYAYELPMALMNRDLTGIETVFLPCDPRFVHVSSSLVKEVARYGGDVAPFLTPDVLDAVRSRLRGDPA